MDNTVIMQEVLNIMRRKKGAKGYMMIKVNFEKKYDLLLWSFIRDTLKHMNLPILLINVYYGLYYNSRVASLMKW